MDGGREPVSTLSSGKKSGSFSLHWGRMSEEEAERAPMLPPLPRDWAPLLLWRHEEWEIMSLLLAKCVLYSNWHGV